MVTAEQHTQQIVETNSRDIARHHHAYRARSNNGFGWVLVEPPGEFFIGKELIGNGLQCIQGVADGKPVVAVVGLLGYVG